MSSKISVEGPGAGTVLEVKEERGLGTTLDVILYDGTLAIGDEIAVATQGDVVVTKVRSLLKPRPMKEILVEDRFERVKSVAAASGIKVTAPNLEGVIAGSPFFVVRDNREEVEARIKKEMTEIHVNLSDEGIVIKADTIGALEALCKELEGKEIGVMRAEVGPVSRLNLIETETVKNPMYRVLLSFNTPILPDAAEMIKDPLYTQVKVFEGRVIYQLIDQYVAWRDEQKRLQEKQRFEHVVMPAKIRLLPDCVFRQSNPAVVGVRVLGGKLQERRGPDQDRREEGGAPQVHAAPAGIDPGSGSRSRSRHLNRGCNRRAAGQRGRRPFRRCARTSHKSA